MKLTNILTSQGRVPSSSLLGIEIKTNLLRFVELSYDRKGYKLERCNELALFDNEVNQKYREDYIIEWLKLLVTKNGFGGLALSHSEVKFKEFPLAQTLPAKELKNYLQFHLQKTFSNYQELGLDYQIVQQEGKLNIQAIVVEKKLVEEKVALLQAANLTPKIIDIDIYAIKRAVAFQLKEFEGAVVVVTVEHGVFFIEVFNQDRILYWNEEFIGKDYVHSNREILTLLAKQLEIIKPQLTQPLTNLVLGGELALFPGILTMLESQFNLPVTIANPFLGMRISKQIASNKLRYLTPLLLVSCGVALRCKDEI